MSNNNRAKTVCIQGEPGMGKTFFSLYLTYEWSKAKCDEKYSFEHRPDLKLFTCIDTLKEFDFLFYIELNEANGVDCDIQDMIKHQILEEMFSSKKYGDEFLSRLLDAKCCLIILDGLDEWHHEQKSCGRRRKSLPHRKQWQNSTVMYTTRPWKLCNTQIEETTTVNSIQINGIANAEEFMKAVVSDDNTRCHKEPESFIKQVNKAGFEQFARTPILLMQLICLWRAGSPFGVSKCEIYSYMLNLCLSKLGNTIDHLRQGSSTDLPRCLEKPDFCRRNCEFVMKLANVAFQSLITVDKDLTAIFEHQLDISEQQLTLQSGIISQRKSRSVRTFSYFLHKTFQEFLAAVYISITGDTVLERCFKMYGKAIDIFDISEIFVFVCGMNPSVAYTMSVRIMSCLKYFDHFTDIQKHVLNVQKPVRDFQRLILSGMLEADKNGHTDIQLHLTHADINKCNIKPLMTEHDIQLVTRLLKQNKNRMVTIGVHVDSMTKETRDVLVESKTALRTLILQYVKGESLDLRNCLQLERLYLLRVTDMEIHINSNLIVCQVVGVDEHLQGLVFNALKAGAPRLETLLVLGVTTHSEALCKVVNAASKLKHLKIENSDLKANALNLCACVTEVYLCGVSVDYVTLKTVVVNLRNILHQVHCDIKQCNVTPIHLAEFLIHFANLSLVYNVTASNLSDSNMSLELQTDERMLRLLNRIRH